MTRSNRRSTTSAANRLTTVRKSPFDESGEIDEPTLRKEADWAFEYGINRLTVAMVSEILRMDQSERRVLTELVCSVASSRRPVVVSVGTDSTKGAVELTRHAEAAGAAAVMAIPPISATQGPEDLFG